MQSGNTQLVKETTIRTTSETNTNPHLHKKTAPEAHNAILIP